MLYINLVIKINSFERADKMKRVTNDDLEILVNRLNKITGSPMTAHTIADDGDPSHYNCNVGHYLLDFAYGGVNVERYINKVGDVVEVFPRRMPKKELQEKLFAFLDGYETALNDINNQ